MFFGRTDAKAETPILWPPHVKSWLIGKDSDAGRDWGQEEKGTTEDEMAEWHYQLNGHEFGWTLGVGDGQGGPACCNSWGRKESDMTEWLNWTERFCEAFPQLLSSPSSTGPSGSLGLYYYLLAPPWEGNGNPLQYSCLGNPMDGGAWWAAVHGVTKSQTWLRDFAFTFHFHALEKETANHSSILAWRIPGMGAWWAAVYGVVQSRTRLTWLSIAPPLGQSLRDPGCYPPW